MTNSQPRLAAKSAGWRLADFGWITLGGLFLFGFIAITEQVELPPVLDVLINILRISLGLSYVLFVPGYCLTAALFPRHDVLDGIERLGLSIGLSAAWVPVLAYILDKLPWGLRLWPIVIGQMLSILLFTAIAISRRARLPAAEAYVPPRWRPVPWWRSLMLMEKRIYLLCAGAMLLAGLALAWVFLVPSPDEFMTEFYILGPEGLAENYPREASSGELLTVHMGISNKERDPMTYRVEVWAVDPWYDRQERVGETGTIQLDVGQTHEQPISWSMPWPGDDQQVLFYLYTQDQPRKDEDPPVPDPPSPIPTPYRQLRLWLDVTDFTSDWQPATNN